MFRSDHPFFLPLSTLASLLLGLLITLSVFFGVRHLEHQKMRADFLQSADIHLRTVVNGFEDMVHDLHTVTQFFIAIDNPSREQFRVFSEPLLQRSPYIYALSFQRLIAPSQRAEYEAQTRKLYPDFRIRELNWKVVPPTEKESEQTPHQMRVVDYIEPMKGNEAAFGLDVSTNPAQNGPMERARDTGLPSASHLFNVAQLRNNKWGFIILMPVYRHNAVLNSVDDRRREVIGFTSAVLQADQVVGKILDNEGKQPLSRVVLN
ncbi:MAG: CHASE domain-containing protein, partial [Glaciimonas sp.]|nr:CHASE domain-containing protein [Glaciimonas sp.]